MTGCVVAEALARKAQEGVRLVHRWSGDPGEASRSAAGPVDAEPAFQRVAVS